MPNRVQIGSRSLFSTLHAQAYLNHAAISPPSDRVVAAVSAALADLSAHGLGVLPAVLPAREQLRARLAAFVGVDPADLALTEGTTRGVIDIAASIPWEEGDGLLLFDGEFPANVTPWQQAAVAHGLRPRFLPLDGFGDGSGDGLSRVEQALHAGGVRLIAVSAVQFQTGLAMPLQALAALAHAAGAELFVDGIQAAGLLPLDLGALGVDYFVTGAHKWLMGLEGAGFACIAPGPRAALRPRTAGWLSHVDGLRFLGEGAGHLRYDRPFRSDAAVLEGGARNSLGLIGLGAALEALEALGPAAIFAHVQRYHDALEPILIEAGLESVRAADPAARSGSLSARPPAGWSVGALARALAARGVMVSTPDGYLRFAPHWPNSLDEVGLIAEALAAARAEGPTRWT